MSRRRKLRRELHRKPRLGNSFRIRFGTRLDTTAHHFGSAIMKRAREDVPATDLTELLQRLEALSIVVNEELPHVLKTGAQVPHRFTKAAKLKKETSSQSQ